MKITKAKNRYAEKLEDLLQRFPKRPCVICRKKDRAPIYLNGLGKLCPECLDDLVQSMRGLS